VGRLFIASKGATRRRVDGLSLILREMRLLASEHNRTVAERWRPAFVTNRFGPPKADVAFAATMAEKAAQYREHVLLGEVRGAAWSLFHSTSWEDGPRFWLSHVLERPGDVLARLPEPDLARDLAGVSEEEVMRLLQQLGHLYQARARGQLRHDPALDGGAGRDCFYWLSLEPGTTFVRWEVSADRGIVGKIFVDEELRGLGLARRMLTTMLELHPEVCLWNTTPQTGEGSQLFAHMRQQYPNYTWST
jgi:GNAT superfamily N-acetyltransferase